MNYYRKICIRYVTGEITEEENKLLQKWISKSSENERTFNEIKTIWENTGPLEMPGLPDTENEWKLLLNRIETAESKKSSIRNKSLREVFLPLWKPALAISLVILVTLTALIILSQEEPVQSRLIMTANMEKRNIQLSDGTVIYLNAGTRINFPDKFTGDKREVRLSGEAYFSVKKDSRPFIVVTDNAKTTVLGTKFNVWARDEKTRVTVNEGLVSLSPKITSGKVLISRGQQSEIIKDQHPATPENVNTDYMLGWIENRLTFNQTPLKEIVSELERNYNVQVELKNKNLEDYTLTGSFRNKDIDSVLSAICLTLDIIYEKNDNNYIIKN